MLNSTDESSSTLNSQDSSAGGGPLLAAGLTRTGRVRCERRLIDRRSSWPLPAPAAPAELNTSS
jgi:hypothetical protein